MSIRVGVNAVSVAAVAVVSGGRHSARARGMRWGILRGSRALGEDSTDRTRLKWAKGSSCLVGSTGRTNQH